MMAALEAVKESTDLYVTTFCVDDAAQFAAQGMDEWGISGAPGFRTLASILGAVDHWMAALNLLRAPRANATYRRTTELLRRDMGEAAYLLACQEGQSMPVERILCEASDLIAALDRQIPQAERTPEWEKVAAAPGGLSERERQVLGLVADGLTNQQIGERLAITERTVRFHVTSLFNKLGADNRAQAVAIANRLGLL